MRIISDGVITETLEEMGGFSEDRAMEEMEKLARMQPHLVSFMMEFTQELDDEVREFAIYMFFVVCRIFEKGAGRRIKKVSLKKILKSYESMENFLLKLEGTHEKILERVAQRHISVQPYVMKYIVETLMEPQSEAINIPDEDVGYLFMLFSTVINVLNQAIPD